jgi:hypothetical protein
MVSDRGEVVRCYVLFELCLFTIHCFTMLSGDSSDVQQRQGILLHCQDVTIQSRPAFIHHGYAYPAKAVVR